MNDAVILIRDIAGDAAQKAANQVNPSDDQLAQIDQAAEDNTWHEAPDLSKDNLKSQFQSKVPIGKKDAQDAAGDASQAADKGAQGVDSKSGAQAGAQNVKNLTNFKVR